MAHGTGRPRDQGQGGPECGEGVIVEGVGREEKIRTRAKIMKSLFKKELNMDWKDRIIIDPKILVGKPVIKGTRLAVEFIVGLLAQGWAESEITRNYPGVTHEDISACLKYATNILKAEKIYPFELSKA